MASAEAIIGKSIRSKRGGLMMFLSVVVMAGFLICCGVVSYRSRKSGFVFMTRALMKPAGVNSTGILGGRVGALFEL